MATIEDLVRTCVLELFAVPGDVNRLPVRPLWLSQDLIAFVDGTLVYDTEEVAGRTAYEHLEQFFVDFRCDERLYTTDLHRMRPTIRGVWSMHPPMLRVYGWVPHPHSVVAVCAQFEKATKNDRNLNDKCRNSVLNFIKQHEVTEIFYGDVRDAFPKAT